MQNTLTPMKQITNTSRYCITFVLLGIEGHVTSKAVARYRDPQRQMCEKDAY